MPRAPAMLLAHLELTGNLELAFTKDCRSTHRHTHTVNCPPDTAAGDGAERSGPRDGSARASGIDDRPSKRVFAVGLCRCGQPEHLVPASSIPATSRTTGRPMVNVPVLSNSTALTVRIRSRASRSLTKIPERAAIEVEIAITSGIASPSACGHEITRTVTLRSTAWFMSPSAAQTKKVTSQR